MLVGFSVSNYKSFYEAQSISFVASKIARHKNHVLSNGKRKILKSALIFGANAGGKSNLIHAIEFSRDVVLNDLDNVDLNKAHFRIISEMYRKPGIFEYRIMIDKKEYSYGIAISYEKREIIGEWLIRIENNGDETYIFNREVDDQGISHAETEVKFKSKNDDYRMKFFLESFERNISNDFKKKTMLNDIGQRVNETKGVFLEIKKVYEWFKNIVIIFPSSLYKGINEIASDDYKKQLYSILLNYFDTGIESVEGESLELDFDKILRGISKDELDQLRIQVSQKVNEKPAMIRIKNQIYVLRKNENGMIVYNKILQNHGNKDDLFEYTDESDGTKRLFDLIALFNLNDSEKVILIDEIDRSLHTMAVKKFIELFYHLTKNKEKQLIATTHDSNLLDLDLLRQDEIWFVERQKDHASLVYSLNKFKERFDKKIEKDYLLGRYGAIPIFDENLIMEESYEE